MNERGGLRRTRVCSKIGVMRSVLDIGAGPEAITLPPYFAGWKRVRLDVDAATNPDLLLDARELSKQPAGAFDAVYCAHNLEHYHRSDGLRVLNGIRHVLKPKGFAEFRVPDLGAVFKLIAEKNLDVDDILYTSGVGPILVRDVIYGYQPYIENAPNDFYSHKTGFTRKSLHDFFSRVNFERVVIGTFLPIELTAFAFVTLPTPEQAKMLSLPESICAASV